MADQLRIQDAKEKLQAAYDQAVSSKEQAEQNFKSDEEMGLTDGQNFQSWSAQNAPAYHQADQEYRGARAAYEAALQNGDREGFQAWQAKVKQVAYDNAGPNGPDFQALIGPN